MIPEEQQSRWRIHESRQAKEEELDDAPLNRFDKAAAKAKATSRVPSPTSQFESDRQNKFTRHDSVTAERTKWSQEHDTTERKEELEKQRREWQRSDVARTSSGTTMDAELSELKRASDADRAARKNVVPLVLPQISAVIACIEKWEREQSSFFKSTFNYTSLCHYLVEGFAKNWFALSVESVASAFSFLMVNGYLETAPDEHYDPQVNAIVRKRGIFSKSAPQMYPTFVVANSLDAAKEAAERERELAEALAKYESERKALANIPFEELKKQARKDFKPPKPGGPNLDRS